MYSNGDDGNQYIPFDHISLEIFEKIKEKRLELIMKATLSYFPDIQTLIVKIPSQAHEKAHEKLRQLILLESIAPPMNLAISTFALMGSTMLKGKNGSFRETVAAWKNANIRSREGDFLRLVVQAG